MCNGCSFQKKFTTVITGNTLTYIGDRMNKIKVQNKEYDNDNEYYVSMTMIS